MHGAKGSHEERGKLVATNMAGRTPRQLATEFKAFRLLRPSLGKAVLHVSLAMPPDERPISDDEWAIIVRDYLDGIGLGDDVPFSAWRHSDTDHDHVHLIASRIRPDGSVLSDKGDFRISQAVVRKLEIKHGLKTVTSTPPPKKRLTRGQQQLKQKTGGKLMTENLSELLDFAINEATDLLDFIGVCESLGIVVSPHLQNTHIAGVIYEFCDHTFKGSDLGKAYTWAGITSNPKLKYDPTIHLQKIRQMMQARKNIIRVNLSGDNKKKAILYRRQLLSLDYQQRVRALFGQDLDNFKATMTAIYIKLKNGGKITDFGDRLQAVGMPPAQSAKHLIAIAKEKNWKEVSVSGSGGFVMEAMNEALDAGMTVVPKNEEQKQLLAEVIEQRNMRANANVVDGSPPSGMSQKLAQRRLDNLMKDRPKPSYKPSGT